ncbi:MAG: type II toxin-antitoxin system RelE/ParE family toxin [Deltaproteobacteria bacterium]|nr:type II toxin-antitoxin system RelE/ParE family toxin [Deltaproteobacteria bacterium]
MSKWVSVSSITANSRNITQTLPTNSSIVSALRESNPMTTFRLAQTAIRSLPVKKYVIYYRLKQSTVEIVRVLSGYRDINRIFQ